MKFLEDNKILCDSQFGFRENHSTSLALLEIIENITTSIDKVQFTAGVFIDLKKAFDTIDHTNLVEKLKATRKHFLLVGYLINMFKLKIEILWCKGCSIIMDIKLFV